jgi:hypothetical protein
MNHTDLIGRAARVVWRYKVLWLFGILLALTSGGGGSGSGYQFSGGDISERMPSFPGAPWFPGEVMDWSEIAPVIGSFALLCCCLLVILIVVSTIVRYVAKAALYRMVDQVEETGHAPTWREGFRLGWSNRTFRLWLLELLIGLAFVLISLLLLIPVLSPLLLFLTESDGLRALGVIMTTLLALGMGLLFIVAVAAVSGLQQFWGREVVLADKGIGAAISEGFDLVRRNFKDVFIMWLLMLGVGLLFGLAMIPVGLVLILLAGAVGGGIGWLMYQVTDSMGWAFAFGAPLFLALTAIPFALIGGLYMAFESAVWTLTYREVVD